MWERGLSFIKITTVITTEYFLSVYNKAHIVLNFMSYKYCLIFYPENKTGTNFTRILQNEEIEARSSFTYLSEDRSQTKAQMSSKAFNP